ncbi:MAG TPA: 30S ribosomal protein S17 [Candidatus Pacebacteria bacterium]|nr:30S ribosomal protein S17 [Candidatus Paceibacterota bacterium]
MKTLQGEVVSLTTAQTAQVKVTRMTMHPLYKKSLKRSSTYACHTDENLKLQVGDKVEIAESRPMSATKHFKVIQKIAIA